MSSFFPRGPHNTQLRNWKILAAPSIKISNFIMNFVKTVELFIRIKSRIVLISRVVSLGYRIVRLYALKRIEARLREWERWRQRRQKEPDIREFLAVLKSIPMEKKTCQDHVVHWELKRGERADIERLINLSCYRGIRHQDGLPLHGQRTHTNARTCRSRKQMKEVYRLGTCLINHTVQ